MIEVVNIISAGVPKDPWDVYIGRAVYGTEGSPLGNPFPLSKYSRDKSVDNYHTWLIVQVVTGNKPVIKELERLVAILKEHKKLRLFCWCAPLRCHGDVIKSCITAYLKEGRKELA